MVRSARPGDEAALAELRWRWRSEESRPVMGHDEFVAAFMTWVDVHRQSHRAWLAEVDGEPVGMAWLALLERIPGPDRWARSSGSLQSVYVVPERRGAGTGAALVAVVLQTASALGVDYVTVHPSPRSVSLYRRAGFDVHLGALEHRRL